MTAEIRHEEAVARLIQGASARVSAERPRLRLLAGFELLCHGESVTSSLPTQRMLAFLALNGVALQRVHVAGSLWPEVDERHANASLRAALCRLQAMRPNLVNVSATQIQLASDVSVDVQQLIVLARALHTRGAAGLGNVATLDAIDPWVLSRELLPDWYDDWVLLERERLRQLSLHVLEALATRLAEIGRYMYALEAALAAVRIDPLRESSHRKVIAVHLAEGNASEALRHYRAYRAQLRAELGIEPSARVHSLLQAVGATVTSR